MYCHLQILYANKIISSAYLPFILRDLSIRSPLNFHQQTNIFHTIDQLKMVTLSTHCKTSLSFFLRHLDNMLISMTTIKVHIFTALLNDVLPLYSILSIFQNYVTYIFVKPRLHVKIILQNQHKIYQLNIVLSRRCFYVFMYKHTKC